MVIISGVLWSIEQPNAFPWCVDYGTHTWSLWKGAVDWCPVHSAERWLNERYDYIEHTIWVCPD